MFKKLFKKNNQNNDEQTISPENVNKNDNNDANIFEPFQRSTDFVISSYENKQTNLQFEIGYYTTLIDEKIVQETILPNLLRENFLNFNNLKSILPVEQVEIVRTIDELEYKLMTGFIVIKVVGDHNEFATVSAKKELVRDITPSEIESTVFGPKEAFVESLDQNINLVRKRLPIKECVIEEVTIGSLSKTRIAFMYIDNLANPENVNTVRQRLQNIEFDQISDIAFIAKFLNDHTNTVFPQMLSSERPDRASAALTEGSIIILADGSPSALLGPASLISFIISFEDYYVDWIVASFLRLIRMFSILFSISISAIYVAVVTYHYQLIPRDLLSILVSSRREIPFPPILEALILEVMIEILREAGARLPTKIGHTIGIVGGIVIGTASVEAGLASNVLLIIVAMAALASFTTPVYQIGNAIRLLRFPFLLFAHLWGLIGIAFCAALLLAHLLQLTSLGRPYLQPFYPLRFHDWKDTIISMPLKFQAKLPRYTEPQGTYRFNKEKSTAQDDFKQ